MVGAVFNAQMGRPHEARGYPTAWREKLAINFIIWFICACAVFVIVFLGLVICSTEHVFSTSELASHSYTTSANNVYISIRGEVFDLTTVSQTPDKIFPVQVSRNYRTVNTF
jgi:chitin synthase